MNIGEVMAAIQQAFFSRIVCVFVQGQESKPCIHGWFPITVKICIQVEPCGNIWIWGSRQCMLIGHLSFSFAQALRYCSVIGMQKCIDLLVFALEVSCIPFLRSCP